MREKLFRDPVHDFITVEDPLLLQLIDTPEFQRLRRIRQLGSAYGTYHGAEHSRFGHSMGVMFIMNRILEHLRHAGYAVDDEVAVVARCAALLHDLGHGPLSHTLEYVLTEDRSHEMWTKAMLEEDTAVAKVLTAVDPSLPGKVGDVIDGSYAGPNWVNVLTSSQMDVDRMDYLLRDSLYTGVTYGRFDLKWLISTITIANDEIVLMNKGLSAAEQYVLARYFMYWQVYLHHTTRGHELVLHKMWDRAKYLFQSDPSHLGTFPVSLRPFLAGEVDLHQYLAVDDFDVWYVTKLWKDSADAILSDLARRYIDRNLLKPTFKVPKSDVPLENLNKAQDIVGRAGWDPEYYLIVDRTSDVAYDYYTEGLGEDMKHSILVKDENGRTREIAKLSDSIRAIASRRKMAVNIYAPAECIDQIRPHFTVG